MGDDTPDLPMMRRAALAIAVADAHAEVIEAADWVTTHKGGDGAVREVCDLLLRARQAPASV
jgi:3-deoxy-D-manno-octulosonate 8-phosphate phosphatase (KDO 8-P phosphatase)